MAGLHYWFLPHASRSPRVAAAELACEAAPEFSSAPCLSVPHDLVCRSGAALGSNGRSERRPALTVVRRCSRVVEAE
jgi:hypothetical protein